MTFISYSRQRQKEPMSGVDNYTKMIEGFLLGSAGAKMGNDDDDICS